MATARLPTEQPDVLVAGAGVAGLACAAALAHAGAKVLVLEQASRCGGRASSWIDESGDPIDIGPHVVSSEHRQFMALLEGLGTAHAIRWQPDPLITLVDRGRALAMRCPAWMPPFHAIPNLPNALRCLSWGDILSNLRVAWHAAMLDETMLLPFDRLDALTYLRGKGVSERSIEWFWASAMLALLNTPLAELSTASLLRVFRLMLGRSGYHFGFATVGLADLYVPGCRRVIEAAGGAVCVSRGVRRVLMCDGTFAGFMLDTGETIRARCGVLAVPPAEAATLMASAQPGGQPAPWMTTFEPSPYLSTMLWFDRPVTRTAFWARVFTEGGLNMDFYDLARIRTGGADAPSLIACNAIHAVTATQWSDHRVVAQCRKELEAFAPGARDALLRHARVHRIPMAVPKARPGFESTRPDAASAVPGVWLAGDWTRTETPACMESAARSGTKAAVAVAARLGRMVPQVLPLPETGGLVGLVRSVRLTLRRRRPIV